jgi:hypothetical protein
MAGVLYRWSFGWKMGRESMTVIENVVQRLAHLPPGSQLEVLDFAEFLAEKVSRRRPLFDPEGLWADQGSDISREEIAEARREMWGKCDRREEL